MEPNTREKQTKIANQLLKYVYEQQGVPVPKAVEEASKAYYGGNDEAVAILCGTIRGMSEEEMDKIMYDGRSPDARKLANWWELHKIADEKREAQASAEEQQKAVIEGAKAKLSKEEIDALGI